MEKKGVLLIALSSILLLGGTASAITVDGNPTDWLGSVDPHWSDAAGQLAYIDGLSTPGDAANDFAFTPNLPASDLINNYAAFMIEDGRGYNVGPGVGGQNFDMEAMYGWYINNAVDAYAAGDGLYTGVFTGFDPEGEGAGLGEWDPLGQEQYAAGDLFFDFGADGSWDLAIEVTGDSGSLVGDAYIGSGDWFTETSYPAQSKPGLIDYSASVTDVSALFGGPVSTEFAYSDRDASDHNFIEAYLDENFLIWGSQTYGWDIEGADVAIHWTQSCGNDVGNVTPTIPPDVPEPATMAMLGCLGVGMFVARKVRGKKS